MGAAMEGALYRMRDGYIRMHARRHAHSSERLVLGSERKRVIVKDVSNLLNMSDPNGPSTSGTQQVVPVTELQVTIT